MKKIPMFTGCILLTLLVGGISGYITVQDVNTWYVTLHKPSFNPPNYLFGPVWTVLYLLMGISFYLVLKQPRSGYKETSIFIFLLQLILNFFWSIIFFHMHLIHIALADILLLWIMIAAMIFSFYHISKAASLLQLPYLAWVSFATLLNAAIFHLN